MTNPWEIPCTQSTRKVLDEHVKEYRQEARLDPRLFNTPPDTHDLERKVDALTEAVQGLTEFIRDIYDDHRYIKGRLRKINPNNPNIDEVKQLLREIM